MKLRLSKVRARTEDVQMRQTITTAAFAGGKMTITLQTSPKSTNLSRLQFYCLRQASVVGN